MAEKQKPKRSGKVRLDDLAAAAGVSVATVSRALNDHPAVNADTKRRVWKIAREKDYVLRPGMPTVLSGALATIMVVIPPPQGREGNISDPFYLELIGGIGVAARESRCDILISHIAPQTEKDLVQLMSESRADGVIFLGQSGLHDQFNSLAEANNRFVVWGADLPGRKYCSVGSDNIRGGRRATAHLTRMGRNRIAFLGYSKAAEVHQRYLGYSEALQQSGIEIDPELVLPVQFQISSAEVAVDALLARNVPFDAIFAASDLIAMGAVRALARAGIDVPGDVSVVGYDDLQLARYGRPALTTISQEMTEAGRILVSKMLNTPHSDSLTSERLPTDLIVRESCGA
ncbi:MAG: LacI family DNA-binding transcriptional regulator [Pseudomonadota bacterium]